MMRSYDGNQNRWQIALADDEDKRLASLTRRIAGDATPKQFCSVIGDSSLIEQTRRRVSLSVADDRNLIVVTRVRERSPNRCLETCASKISRFRLTTVASPSRSSMRLPMIQLRDSRAMSTPLELIIITMPELYRVFGRASSHLLTNSEERSIQWLYTSIDAGAAAGLEG